MPRSPSRRCGASAVAVIVAILLVTPKLPAVAGSGPADRLFALINQSRSSAGLGPLTRNANLNGIAQRHSQDMATQGRLFHNASLAQQAQPWRAVGENVGIGSDPDAIHRAFMGSSRHRANIFGRNFNLVGIGVVQASGKLWVVQDFVGRDGLAIVPAGPASGARRSASPAEQGPPVVETPAPAPVEGPAGPVIKIDCRGGICFISKIA